MLDFFCLEIGDGRAEFRVVRSQGLQLAIIMGVDLGLEHVVMTRIYLTRFKEDYTAMNETYRGFFPPDRLPARTCVGVTGLAYDALIEIDLVCRRP